FARTTRVPSPLSLPAALPSSPAAQALTARSQGGPAHSEMPPAPVHAPVLWRRAALSPALLLPDPEHRRTDLPCPDDAGIHTPGRSEEHTSELQSRIDIECHLP